MSTTVHTCLWFDSEGEEAARFYVDLVDDAELGEIATPPEGTPNTVPGVPVTVSFTLGGQRFTALNGGPHFPPSEYASIVLECDTQEQADRYWAALTSDGGSESQCGWCKDRWGVSWQIVPQRVNELLTDPATAQRAYASMLTMARLDSEAMERDCGLRD